MDSDARYPHPTCYQGTSEQIRARLTTWLDNPERQRKVVWLTGPAGTGKSTIAQTFAESCLKKGRLGAAFFFSRKKNSQNEPTSIIPTLAYQLAVHFPDYKPLLSKQMAHDPTIVNKTPRTQFERLIIEPFSILRTQGHRVTRDPLLILLDDLDAYQGIPVQSEFVKMIGEAVRSKDLPLLWLICSRPEPHLRYVFSRLDCDGCCGKEELSIDAKVRDDVGRYLRGSFEEFRAKFWGVASPSPWPPDLQLSEALRIASGLFFLASVIVDYVGDPVYANPAARLSTFLELTSENTHVAGTENPLEPLDLLYSDILTEIPNNIFLTTTRILGHLLVLRSLVCDPSIFSTQALCNFMNMDQATFYGALQRLHSVIQVPAPEDASGVDLQFYHGSFPSYLLDSTRSGKFAIDWGEAVTGMAKSCLFWYNIDLNLFHTTIHRRSSLCQR